MKWFVTLVAAEPQASSQRHLPYFQALPALRRVTGGCSLVPTDRLRGGINSRVAGSLSRVWHAERCSRSTDHASFTQRGCKNRLKDKLSWPLKICKTHKLLGAFLEAEIINKHLKSNNITWSQFSWTEALFLWFCCCLTLVPLLYSKSKRLDYMYMVD